MGTLPMELKVERTACPRNESAIAPAVSVSSLPFLDIPSEAMMPRVSARKKPPPAQVYRLERPPPASQGADSGEHYFPDPSSTGSVSGSSAFNSSINSLTMRRPSDSAIEKRKPSDSIVSSCFGWRPKRPKT